MYLIKIFAGALLFTFIVRIAFPESFSQYEAFSIGLTIAYLAYFIHTLGVELLIGQCIALVACIQYLLAPAIVYGVYQLGRFKEVDISLFMPLNSTDYFSYAIPGTLALILGLELGRKERQRDRQILGQASQFLKARPLNGLLLVLVGGVAAMLRYVAPIQLEGILYLISQFIFVGAIYVILSDMPRKSLVVTGVLAILLAQCIVTGMYGELIGWTLLGTATIMLRKSRIGLASKFMIAVVGVFLILLIQSIKHEYRDEVWGVGIRDYDANYFFSLVTERLSDPLSVVEPARLYQMTVRANQGYLIASAMNYVPKFEPYANGETILRTMAASIVPRFLWVDKPEAGGYYNRCRFLGDCAKRDYSYNIGQMGEAYVNFGRIGGIALMFFYGLFISYAMNVVRRMSNHRPTIILWSTLLFYAFLSLESDFLTSINSFVKASVLCVAVYLSFKVFLRVRL